MSKLLAFACGMAMAIMPTFALAQEGDVEAGKVVFKKCMACHNADSDKAKVGPTLKGIIGRQPGTFAGFKYSTAMVEFGNGKVWDEALLKSYLPNPKALVKGTKMVFPGLKKEKEVVDLIAYLKSVSPAQ
jgi:cytochrome c